MRLAFRRRAAVLAAAVAAVTTAVAPDAGADTAPAPGTPATVSADALPTWQIDGVVWDSVTVGDTVYATGDFDRARPPGTAASDTAGVARHNLLAMDIRTGEVTGFRLDLNGEGRRIEASPDRKTVYVGGDFTTAGGAKRSRIAAFDAATGQLTSFAPKADSMVRAIAVTSSSVFFGGSFTHVNGEDRRYVAGASRSTGALLAWKPMVDRTVYAMVAASDSRIVLGGSFQTLNGRERVGIGAVDAVRGKSLIWKSNPIPAAIGTHKSYVTDLVRSGSTIYGSANGDGTFWFDGRFAVIANSGSLRWLDNCYGATYSVFVTGSVLYSVGHAHDCRSVGGFGTTKPATYHRALAETTVATGRDPMKPGTNSSYRNQPTPSLLHWYPSINAGTFTGQNQGAWTVTGNSDYVVLGGEFTKVNGQAQQGLTRFAATGSAPNAMGPVYSTGLTPVLTAGAGTVAMTWTRTWDMDNAKLRYSVQRDGVEIADIGSSSTFYKPGTMRFTDTDVPAGSHRYRVVVRDAFGNTTPGPSATATVG